MTGIHVWVALILLGIMAVELIWERYFCVRTGHIYVSRVDTEVAVMVFEVQKKRRKVTFYIISEHDREFEDQTTSIRTFSNEYMKL